MNEFFIFSGLFTLGLFLALFATSIRKKRQRRQYSDHSETIPHPSMPLPSALSMIPDQLDNYVMIAKFRTLDSYSDHHLGLMVAVLTEAGIPAFWKTGQSNALLFDVGGAIYELWVDVHRVEEAQEVLERDYFRKR